MNNEMTDLDLVGYCEIHCKSERALFSVEHVNRMLNLAGQHTLPPYVTGFMPLHDEMEELCEMARDRMRMSDLQNAKVGSKLWFAGERQGYTIQARNDRYLICTKPFNLHRTEPCSNA